MESFNHLKFAELEHKIIEKNNSYSGLLHDFSDSGKMSGQVISYEWYVLRLSDYQKLFNIDFKNSDVFFGLFACNNYSFDNLFFSTLSKILLKNNSKVIKADTTKSPSDFSFIALCVCKCNKESQNLCYGSIDSYVEDVHFTKSEIAYKISELSAASDVLTNNIKLKNIYSLNFNSKDNDSFFSNSKIENISFYEKEIYVHIAIGSGENSNYKVCSGDYLYLVGYAGYSKFLNYNLDFDYIYKNVLSIRERVFTAFGMEFIASDISDGFNTTLKNLSLLFSNFDFEINFAELLLHCRKVNKEISIEHILTGGDDYSLLLISNKLVNDEDITIIGEVS